MDKMEDKNSSVGLLSKPWQQPKVELLNTDKTESGGKATTAPGESGGYVTWANS